MKMVQYLRRLKMELPYRQSAFLWGPRKTGKSTYIGQRFPDSLVYDFLKTDLMLDFNRRPALLREQLLAKSEAFLSHPIVLDEVQRVPLLLDEVHWLIENRDLRFILCGSSARKLKRGRANLLGGRAWRYEMYPLVTDELNDGDLDILKILNRGLIPDHFSSTQYRRSLNAYLQDYLKEEVFAEGLTRDIPAFSRFFEAMEYAHGELTNFSNIGRECGVSSKTVKEYYQILVDTLLGSMVGTLQKKAKSPGHFESIQILSIRRGHSRYARQATSAGNQRRGLRKSARTPYLLRTEGARVLQRITLRRSFLAHEVGAGS